MAQLWRASCPSRGFLGLPAWVPGTVALSLTLCRDQGCIPAATRPGLSSVPSGLASRPHLASLHPRRCHLMASEQGPVPGVPPGPAKYIERPLSLSRSSVTLPDPSSDTEPCPAPEPAGPHGEPLPSVSFHVLPLGMVALGSVLLCGSQWSSAHPSHTCASSPEQSHSGLHPCAEELSPRNQAYSLSLLGGSLQLSLRQRPPKEVTPALNPAGRSVLTRGRGP